jgi:hypothetical protein
MRRLTYHSIQDVAKIYHRHPRTIRDWITKGCLIESGERIKLGAVKPGRGWLVPAEALVLFDHRIRPDDGRPDLDCE